MIRTDGELREVLIADEWWPIIESLIPPPRSRPQGGGKVRLDDRKIFCAIVFVLTSGCAWHSIPQSFGVTAATAHRRFSEWRRMDLWRRGHEAVLELNCGAAAIEQSRAVLRAALARRKSICINR